jgi:TIR domain
MFGSPSAAPVQYPGRANGANPTTACPANREAKSSRAKERNLIRVFLSHKKKDFRAANQIRDVLRLNSAGRIDVFMSENITKGDDWQGKIEQALYEADWFVLLFSGVGDDWSWCHHEAGIFRGMVYPDSERLVVLYPPNVELPDPLKKYQAVRCQPAEPDEPDELDLFFKEIFGKQPYPGVPPINPVFADEASDTRRAAAERIVQAIGCLVVESIVPENVLFLHVPDISLLNAQEFPEGTRIGRGSGAMRLFELGDTGFSWREFQTRLDPPLRQHLDQSFWPAIYQACAKSLNSCRVASTRAVLRSPADQRNYLPVISRVDITGDNSATFSISFVEVAGGTQAEVRDTSVTRIFTALNLSHRFRWEIIEPYRDLSRLQAFVDHQAGTGNRGTNGAGTVNNGGGLLVIWEAIRLLEIESLNRGVYDEKALPADFGPGAEPRVQAMFPLWHEKRALLERAATDGDVETFARVLRDLDPINVEFISLASQRLGELVRADAPHG